MNIPDEAVRAALEADRREFFTGARGPGLADQCMRAALEGALPHLLATPAECDHTRWRYVEARIEELERAIKRHRETYVLDRVGSFDVIAGFPPPYGKANETLWSHLPSEKE